MRIAIIGRTSLLYNTAKLLYKNGHEIPLIVTSREAPEYTIKAEDFKKLAEEFAAEYIYTPKINEITITERLKKLDMIDLAVSINYSGVISQEVIDIFPLGILNSHGGDLPKYRGNACQAWAIINGEQRTAICIHKMKGGELDSGDIITRKYKTMDLNTRVSQIYDWFEKEVPLMINEAVDLLQKNPAYYLEKQSTDAKDALRCYPRIPSDGKINWSAGAEDVVRLVNASSEPYVGAFCHLNDTVVTIWRAELFNDNEIYLAVPGQVAAINNNDGSVIIITGKGKVKVTEIEMNGKRGLPSEFIKSIRTRLV